MTSLESMLESLVAQDPRRSADRLLAKMCEIAGAEGGALLVPSREDVTVLLSYRLSLAGLGSLPVRFQDYRARLSKSEAIAAPGFVLAAVGDDSGAQTAWVYLENPRTGDVKDLRPFLLGLAKAVGAIGDLVRVPVMNRADSNRASLLRLLEDNDWNIARVSRELGVTRRTLYMRLSAFGIARKKVPRLAKPLTA